jgi:hypothetical protein
MRDTDDRNWGPIRPDGQPDLNRHWRVSFLTLLAIGGALGLGVLVWFAMRVLGG